MLQHKAVIRFAIIVMVIYAGLTLLQSTMERTYSSCFRSFGNIVFSQFWLWPEGRVHFVDLFSPDMREQVNAMLPAALPAQIKLPGHEGVQDTLLVLKNRNTPANVGFLRTSSRIIGYTPTAMLISLILATPAHWKKRLWILFWGMFLVHLFIALRLTVLLLHSGYAADKPYAIFHPGSLMLDVLSRGKTILADNPTFSYLASVFLWLIVWITMQIWTTMGSKKTKG